MLLDSILKRYPELTDNDVSLRDDGDGKGIYIDIWHSDKPKPTMEQVYQWGEEDAQLPKPKTQLELIQDALDDLILGGAL